MELSREELRELLAFEINCAQLVPDRHPGFLEATIQRYGLNPEDMAAFLGRAQLTRADVWDIQVLKRLRQGNEPALQAIRRLRDMEEALGAAMLGSYVERIRMQERVGE